MTITSSLPGTVIPTLLTNSQAAARAASIALSATLRVGFIVDGSLARHHELPHLRETWDRAAQQLLDLATDQRGVRIYTRPATGGLEVGVDGAPASSWLTHPRTFTILREHLAGLLGVPDPVFAVTSKGQVFALRRAEDAYRVPKVRMVVTWLRGFPAEITESGR